MGEIAAAQMELQLRQLGALLDPADPVVQRVNILLSRLVAAAGTMAPSGSGEQWRVVVSMRGAPNAGCLPNGRTFVTASLLALLEGDEGALCGVLAHEVAHVLARHAGEQMAAALLLQAVAVLLGLDPSAISAPAHLLALHSSRRLELEADRVGLILLARAGYDPSHFLHAMVRMAQFRREHEPPIPGLLRRLLNLLSTHPSEEERVQNLLAHMPRAREEYERALRHPTVRRISLPSKFTHAHRDRSILF